MVNNINILIILSSINCLALKTENSSEVQSYGLINSFLKNCTNGNNLQHSLYCSLTETQSYFFLNAQSTTK